MGDFLFSAVNLSRKLKVNAEEAARSGVRRFIVRFHYIEESLRTAGLSPEEVSLEKLDTLWQEAKAREARPAPS
jgi:tetrapyrrole methylase family protein/MazG family protein